MAYVAWSVVFGEQPTAAKWNILGQNDASFNDGTGIADDAIIARHISGFDKSNLTTDYNPYKFHVSRNAAANTGNGTLAIVAFDTEQFDTNNNHSAGVYTAPLAGFYQFNWRLKTITSGAETFQSALYKNGSSWATGTIITNTSQHVASQGNDCIQLAANDTVDIRCAASGGARALEIGAGVCYFSGFLVSMT